MSRLTTLIEEKRTALTVIDESALSSARKPAALRMYPASAPEDETGLAVYYAPFDSVNLKAKVVLIGITPGESQMQRAWQSLLPNLGDLNKLDAERHWLRC